MQPQLRELVRASNPVVDPSRLLVEERELLALYSKAMQRTGNPPTSADLLDRSVERRHEVQTQQREPRSTEPAASRPARSTRRGLGFAVGAVAAVVLIGVVAIALTGEPIIEPTVPPSVAETTAAPEPADPLAVARAYWEAIIAGDVDAAVATVDPTAFEWDVRGFGRPHSIASAIPWLEAIGFTWQLGDCELAGDSDVSCELTGRNDWSDALGMDPVPVVATMTVGENGITVADAGAVFESQWGEAFIAFNDWVTKNHTDDARDMFGVRLLDDEIVELFRVNTERFVAAQG